MKKNHLLVYAVLGALAYWMLSKRTPAAAPAPQSVSGMGLGIMGTMYPYAALSIPEYAATVFPFQAARQLNSLSNG